MDTLLNDLRERLGAKIVRDKLETGQLTIEVNAADITEVCLSSGTMKPWRSTS